MPTLTGTEVSLSYVHCFLCLVSSLVSVSIFHTSWLDTFCTDLVYTHIVKTVKITSLVLLLCYSFSPFLCVQTISLDSKCLLLKGGAALTGRRTCFCGSILESRNPASWFYLVSASCSFKASEFTRPGVSNSFSPGATSALWLPSEG